VVASVIHSEWPLMLPGKSAETAMTTITLQEMNLLVLWLVATVNVTGITCGMGIMMRKLKQRTTPAEMVAMPAGSLFTMLPIANVTNCGVSVTEELTVTHGT